MTDWQPDIVRSFRTTSQDLIDLRSIRTRDVMLGQLVARAVQMLPNAAGAGISRTRENRIRASHATATAIYVLDQLQDRLDEGPCIVAADDPPEDGFILASDLAGGDATRWPRFAPRAVEAGYRGLLSISMASGDGRRAALNFYAEAPDSFDGDAITVGSLFASHAAMLLYGADHAAQLVEAVESRDVIGQAKGILMERFDLDRIEAFEMLVKSSQDVNMKLRVVAEWVVSETEKKHAP